MTTTTEIKGTCKDRFQRVKEAFAANFEDHGEVGASLAVMVDGEMAVDLWGGYADGQRTRPWERDTIVNTYSTTKGMTAICANQLIEQGRLDPEAPVARYWPEFAQAGKDKLPVKYLLSHKAGLPAVSQTLPREASYDWQPLVDALAAQEPWWEPGTTHGYHAVTFGHLVGEVVRRVSGMTVGNYFRKQVAEPLGIDFYIGFGPELDPRCAEMIPAPFQAPPPGHPLFAAFTNPQSMTFKAFMISPEPMLNPNYMNTREFRAAE
ncbi:MAG TPA: serine hydrolase domain-containing protein, partial [Dehalococcoidia bacterium]